MSGSIITIASPTEIETGDSLKNLNEMRAFNTGILVDIGQYHTSQDEAERASAETRLRTCGVDDGWLNPKPNEGSSRASRQQFEVRQFIEFVETRNVLKSTRQDLETAAGANGINLDDQYQYDSIRNGRKGKHLANVYNALQTQERNEMTYIGMIDFRHPPETSSVSLARKTKYVNGDGTMVFNSDCITELSRGANTAKQEIERTIDRARTDAI